MQAMVFSPSSNLCEQIPALCSLSLSQCPSPPLYPLTRYIFPDLQLLFQVPSQWGHEDGALVDGISALSCKGAPRELSSPLWTTGGQDTKSAVCILEEGLPQSLTVQAP